MSKKPESNEYHPYFSRYIDLVPAGPITKTLENQLEEFQLVENNISESDSLFRYAEGKWSIKEVIGHIIDTERVFAYRALAFSREENVSLPGFDQDIYISNATFDQTSFADLMRELKSLRISNVYMLKSLNESLWSNTGKADGNKITVRAIAYILAGHFMHHNKVLSERYLNR